MALQKQRYLLNFVGGVDTKSDPKQVIPSKLLQLENGTFVSPGRIRKRNGYASLSNQALYSTSVRTQTSSQLDTAIDANWPVSASTTKSTQTTLTAIAPIPLPPGGPRLVCAIILWKNYRLSNGLYPDATGGTNSGGTISDSGGHTWTRIKEANFKAGDIAPGHHGAELWATWFTGQVPQNTKFQFVFDRQTGQTFNALFSIFSFHDTVDGSVNIASCFGNIVSAKNAGAGTNAVPVPIPVSLAETLTIQSSHNWAIFGLQDGYDFTLGVPTPTSASKFTASNTTNTTQFTGGLIKRSSGDTSLGANGLGAWTNYLAVEVLGGTAYSYSDSSSAPKNATINTGAAIFSYEDQLIEHDGNAVYSWSSAENAWRAIRGKGVLGGTPAISVSQTNIIKNNGFQLHPDMTVHPSGFTCVAYEDTVYGGVRFTLLDTFSQSAIFFDWPIPVIGNITQVSTYCPKVISFGKWILIFYSSGLVDSSNPGGTGYSLYVAALDTTSPAQGFGYTKLIHGDFPVDPSQHSYDVAICGDRLIFVFTSASSNLIGVNSLDSSLHFSVPPTNWVYLTQVITGPASNSLTCFPGSLPNTVIVSWSDASNVKFAVFDTHTLTLLKVATATEAVVASHITGASISGNSNDIFLCYTVAGDRPNNYKVRSCYITGSNYDITSGPSDLVRSVGLTGKAFQYNGIRYIPTVFESISQPTVFFVDEAGNVVAKALAGSALGQIKGSFDTAALIRSVITVARRTDDDTDKTWDDSECRPRSSSATAPPTNGIVVNVKNNSLLPESTVYGSQVIVALQERFGLGAGSTGGLVNIGTITLNDQVGSPVIGLTANAGVTAVGLTFGARPTKAILANTLHFSGGCLWMYDGATIVEHGFHIYPEGVVVQNPGGNFVYNYIVTYEWMDIQGNLHRSAYDKAVTQAQINPIDTSANSVTLTIPTLRLTAKQNSSNSSFRRPVTCVIYRTAANGSVFHRVNQSIGSTFNDPTVDTITFRDTTTDTQLLENPVLYTTGGVLKNISPNPPKLITMIGNRVWAIDSANSLRLWYSKETIPGAPVEFNDSLTFNLEPRGNGGAVALIPLDDKIVVFRRDCISYIVGEGPDSTGGQNDFREIQLPIEIGCTDPYAISTTSLGLIFKSTKGFFMLDRALTITYVGADVEVYNTYAVTSAQPLPKTNWVVFTLTNGLALLHDFLVKQWSVLTNINAISADVYNGVHVWVDSQGIVWQETPGVFADGAQYIQTKLQTAWISLAGLQGYKRLWDFLVLGDWFSPHLLKVEIAYNFDPTVVQTDIIDFSASVVPIQERIHAATQLCQSFQITLTELPTDALAGEFTISTADTTIGEGLALSALGIEIGVQPGLFKLPAAKSVG